mgnify:CR=1 FL=1
MHWHESVWLTEELPPELYAIGGGSKCLGHIFFGCALCAPAECGGAAKRLRLRGLLSGRCFCFRLDCRAPKTHTCATAKDGAHTWLMDQLAKQGFP